MLWVMVMVMCLLAVRSASQSCQRSCGNVTIPYPFGLEEDDSNCSLDENFKLFCNKNSVPHKLFRSKNRHVPVINISLEGQMTVIVWPAYDCYDENGTSTHRSTTELRLHQGYRFNYTRNKLVGIGCDTQAYISDFENTGFQSGCTSFCWDTTSVSNGTCSGIGCCDAVIPKDVLYINVSVSSFRNHRQCWKFNQCSYAFLADKDWFNFSISDLWQFKQRVKYHIGTSIATPVVLDWAVGDLNCTETKKGERARYACGTNTMCVESNNGPGYLCHCEEGYKGNPYEEHGCQDINECDENLEHKPCMGHCHNTQGSYTCSCPAGQRGDGRTGGSGCNSAILYTTVGGSFLVFLLFLVLGTSWVWYCRQQKKLRQLKMKFFKQNGGTLLQEKLSSHEHSTEAIIVFTSEELKAATNNYQENQILGQGGYGTVYKGILPDGRIVAIKKSRIVDEEQTEQFINEVLILSQINHRNVVKLLGCCLETENPLLVYEFIINGTLFHHIHDKDRKYSISWNNRLRIAAETAGALAYLHSSASQPIIHRDVKSANILLDENYTAKVADFGASRLIALDQTHLSTLVQGTRGYLDPEYLQTSLLTDKSDVYSFGVVLVELLTGRKAFCYDEPEDERNLAMFFVSAMKANHLFEVLEHRVVSEGRSEEIQDVANLAKRCLRVNNEERPTMKEVAIELEGIKISVTHVWTDQKPEESVYLLGEPANSYDGNTQSDSIRTRAINSLHTGR